MSWLGRRFFLSDLIVLALFAAMPLQWLRPGYLGSFSIRPPYLMIFALLALLATRPKTLQALQEVIHRHAFWLVPYALYVVLLAMLLAGTAGQGIPMRQVFFLLSFVATAAAITAAKDIASMMRWAGAIALISFVVSFEIVARQIDQSWAKVISHFVTTGDLDYVVYDFFRAIFNALGDETDEMIRAGEKNGLSVAVFLSLAMFRAGRPPGSVDRIGQVVTVGAVFLLIMLNTRSVLLMTAIGLPLVAWLAMARDGIANLSTFAAKSFAYLFIAIAAVMILSSGHAIFDTLGARFFFEDASADTRLMQWGWAFSRIEGNVFWGPGYAEIDGHPVHNLFVGAWMHAGLPAFLLVITAYLTLVGMVLNHMAMTVLHPERWHLPLRPEWIAILPIVPLFRVWLSGDAGHPIFIEWLALAAFSAALAANAVYARGFHLRSDSREPIRES